MALIGTGPAISQIIYKGVAYLWQHGECNVLSGLVLVEGDGTVLPVEMLELEPGNIRGP